jgi:hypothetical protein
MPSTESRFKEQTIDLQRTKSITNTGSYYKSKVSQSRAETVGSLEPKHYTVVPSMIIDILTGLRKSITGTESRFKAQKLDPLRTQSMATTGSCYNYKRTVSQSRFETVGPLGQATHRRCTP